MKRNQSPAKVAEPAAPAADTPPPSIPPPEPAEPVAESQAPIADSQPAPAADTAAAAPESAAPPPPPPPPPDVTTAAPPAAPGEPTHALICAVAGPRVPAGGVLHLSHRGDQQQLEVGRETVVHVRFLHGLAESAAGSGVEVYCTGTAESCEAEKVRRAAQPPVRRLV